jgi:RHS repeat-associated protein
VVAEWYGTPGGYNGWGKGYVYLGGQLVAQYADSTTYFVHKDHLGSTRLLTKLDKSPLEAPYDYVPYGEPIGPSGSGTTHKFTGKERDAESGLDNFGFRYNSSSLGRFMSPDPFMASGRVENPQTWNRYAYALNNPLRFIDPLGLFASPAYNCTDSNKNCLNDEQRRILNNSTVEIDGKKLSGEALYNALSEKQQNAFVNVTDRLGSITFADGSTALNAVQNITSFQEDRVFANVNPALAESISKDPNFKEVFFFKSQHPGTDISFKSKEAEGSIQFSFNKARTVADIDHDLKNTFFAHLLEATRNTVTGTKTDQDQVRRLLIANPKVGITPSPDPKFNRPQ